MEHPEFFDYAERIKEERLWNEHQMWRHTTFFGRLTQTVLDWAHNNEFFSAIADAFTDQQGGSSPYARTLSISMIMTIVIAGVLGLYAIGRVIQSIIGKEIIVEQKVIIETQVKLSDLLKEGDEEEEEEGDEDEKVPNKRRNKTSKNIKVQ